MKSEKTVTVKLTAAQLALIYNGITFRYMRMKACEEFWDIRSPTLDLQNEIKTLLYDLGDKYYTEEIKGAIDWRGKAPLEPKPTHLFEEYNTEKALRKRLKEWEEKRQKKILKRIKASTIYND